MVNQEQGAGGGSSSGSQTSPAAAAKAVPFLSALEVQVVMGEKTPFVLLAPEGVTRPSVRIGFDSSTQGPHQEVEVACLDVGSAEEIELAIGSRVRGSRISEAETHYFRYHKGQMTFQRRKHGEDARQNLPVTLHWVRVFAQEIPLYKIAFCSPEEWSTGSAKEQPSKFVGPLIIAPRPVDKQDVSAAVTLYQQEELDSSVLFGRRWRLDVHLGWRETRLNQITVLTSKADEVVRLVLNTPAGLHVIRYQRGTALFKRFLPRGTERSAVEEVFGITGCWVKPDGAIRAQSICFTNEIAVR